MTLIGLGVIPYNTNWVKITIVGAGVQLLTASVLGVRIRGLITPEIKNIQCPNCHGYFTSTNLVCQKCGTTMEIPSS